MGFLDVLSNLLDSDLTRELLDKGGKSLRTMANQSAGLSSFAQSEDDTWLGKSFSQWNRECKSIGPLKTANLSPYNHCVGLYRHLVDGEVMYVGRAIELYNGGFRKRLSDYRRENNSARKHQSGSTINAHLDEIETQILIVGSTPEAVEATKQMEPVFIRYYSPEWNKQFN